MEVNNKEIIQADIRLRESIEARRNESYQEAQDRRMREEASRKKEFLIQIQRDNALKIEQKKLEKKEQTMKENLAERRLQEEKLRTDVKRISMI